MANVQVTGVLKDPTDNVAANVPLLLISRVGYHDTLMSSESTQRTDASGNYDFLLVHGTHSISVRFVDKFVYLGTVVVNSDTPSPATINQLLEMTTEPPEPAWVAYVKQLTAQAEQAAQASQTSANAARGYELSAQGHANTAAGHENAALGYRNEAEQFRDQTQQISGLDRVEEAVDAAIDNRNFMVMTEAQARAEANQNGEEYAASGFVHYGKQYSATNYSPINEGMYTSTVSGYANQLRMGRSSGASGSSKADFPVTHIAGFISSLMNMNGASNVDNADIIKFPEAEKGYRTYDSATGTSFNYRTETDPKYGDIASTDNEAVARAFEHDTKNGDFRLGNDGSWSGSAWTFDTNGAHTTNGTTNFTQAITSIAGEYEVEITISAWNGGADLYVDFGGAGQTDRVINVSSTEGVGTYTGRITVPATTDRPIYIHGPSFSGSVSRVVVRKVTEEVVTDRHDLAFFEQYHELVADNEVFPVVIQNMSSSVISGVPMKLSARKKSYFQVYDGQYSDPDATNTEFYCWDWSELTTAQKEQVAEYLGNKLYIAADGTDRLVNVRMRQRTIAGAGNGDWFNTTAHSSDQSLWWSFDSTYQNSVHTHGARDVPAQGKSLGSLQSDDCYASYGYTQGTGFGDRGVWQGKGSSSANGYQGQCHALVLGVVKRLNQGAYHPRFNEQGTARFWHRNAVASAENWHSDNSKKPNGAKDCFISGEDKTAGDVAPFFSNRWGDIAYGSGGTGRDDGRFYDAIYASGQGGMYDMRMSAHDITPYMGEIREKVKAGKYRGKEKVKFTTVTQASNFHSSNASRGRMNSPDLYQVIHDNFGDALTGQWGGNTYIDNGIGFIVNASNQIFNICGVETFGGTDGLIYMSPAGHTYVAANPDETYHVILKSERNSTVSGSFTTKMVIGDPANILQTPQLQAGWEGTWCPVIGDGTDKRFPVTRKNVGAVAASRQYTTDNGASWISGTENVNAVTNDFGSGYAAAAVSIITYTACAAQTEPTSNAVVYQGEDGVKDVLVQQDHNINEASLLTESMLGKVPVGNVWNGRREMRKMTQYRFESGQGRLTTGARNKHEPVDIATSNNSPAVKALAYDSVVNQQMQPHWAFNELVWNQGKSVPSGFTAVSGTETYSFVAGERYKITTPSRTICVLCMSSVETSFNLLDESAIGWQGNSTGLLIMVPWDGTGWGDDSTIRIIDNVGTYNNLNGDTGLYGTHKLAIPCGWVKNVAKAGEA